MKKITFFFVFVLIIQNEVSSQSCLPEGITFWSQEQVDNFHIDFPNCNEVEGTVTIKGSSITNLDGLLVIKAIGGDLIITNHEDGSPNLQNMAGLDNLEYIGGSFHIQVSYSISSLVGLVSLKEIEGDFIIHSVKQLTNFQGLDSLSAIYGKFIVTDNDNLISFNGLESLDICTTNSISITYNNNLTNCEIQNMCEYLSLPTGAINIYNNATGCNSPAEIAYGCGINLTCLPFGNYHFQTQTQVDSFATNYNNCTEIEGSVIIQYSNITNLNGLFGVTSISRSLGLYYNDSLLSIGLNNLHSIGGDLYIAGSKSLIDMEGLNNLVTIGGHLDIHTSGIVNLQGLNNLSAIGEDLNIGNNNNLINFNGLENLTTIGGHLLIRRNDSLTNIMSLGNLNSIGNYIDIENNQSLVSLAGLEKITSMQGLAIEHNGALISLSGLDNLVLIEDDLRILENGIKDLKGLSNLTTVNGRLMIRWNNALSNFIGLERLAVIGEDLWVEHNKYLSSLKGLEKITSLNGDLIIERNEHLLNVLGLGNLSVVGGHVSFHENNSLESLSGLNNLTSIGNSLNINSNHSLSGLSGLINLKIAQGLYIYNNAILSSLSGLDNIYPALLNYVTISSNQALSECEVKSVCDYFIGYNGSGNISNNASGCNSQSEIEDVCIDWVPDKDSESIFSIHPNPATTEVYISSNKGLTINAIIIYNQLGQKVLSIDLPDKEVNISSLNSGIYFIELISNEIRIKEKLIIN